MGRLINSYWFSSGGGGVPGDHEAEFPYVETQLVLLDYIFSSIEALPFPISFEWYEITFVTDVLELPVSDLSNSAFALVDYI